VQFFQKPGNNFISLCTAPNITKNSVTSHSRHIVSMREIKNACRILVRNPLRKERTIFQDNIKIDLRLWVCDVNATGTGSCPVAGTVFCYHTVSRDPQQLQNTVRLGYVLSESY